MTSSSTDRGQDRCLEEAGAWCVRVADGDLSPAERDAFEAWLAAGPDNRSAFDDAVGVWRAMEEASLSPELIDIRRAALDSFRNANRSRWASSRWRTAAAAALVLLMVMGGGLLLRLRPTVYQTGTGERRVVVLTDGSRVSLDAATKVAVLYLGGRRDLRLVEGRAKFDVAKDPLRPFSVSAGDKVVVATGTQFSVELLRRQVHVILYEGHVAVLARPAGAGRPTSVRLASRQTAADQMLTPGRELVANLQTATAQVAAADPGRSLSWEGGQLVFADEPLASAVERVNRYSEDKLEVGDAAAGRTVVNGVYNAGDTPAFVEGVTGVTGLKLAETGGRKIFVSRK